MKTYFGNAEDNLEGFGNILLRFFLILPAIQYLSL